MTRLMGILELEGNVFINIAENKRYNTGYQAEIGYALNSKSGESLEFVSGLLTENNIGHNKLSDKIEICKLEHFKQLVMYVELHKFQNAQRKRQLEVVKRAVAIFDSKEHLKERGIVKLQKLKQELHELKHELTK